jgi:hypothetical protein
MTQTLELKSMGLSQLTETESNETNGGLLWIPAALAIGLFISAVNNFGDIRQGIVDGWNGTPRH